MLIAVIYDSPWFCPLFSEVTLILRFAQEIEINRGGETFLSLSGQLYSVVAGRLSLAPCMCECQTGSHWGGDLRIREKLLAKAVLEVPLVWFFLFVPGEWRLGGGRCSVECRLTKGGGIIQEL